MSNKKEKSHKTIFIDLGEFGKFSKSTLMKNRSTHRYSDGYAIPGFLNKAFNKIESELREYIESLENKQKIHWKIKDIMTYIRRIKNAQYELVEIKELRAKVIKVVNSR